jgi:hypothetical protein
MYENHFDPVEEPSALDVDDLLTRAYALGVAASMGDRHPDELARLLEGTDSVYDRNLVEVAHEEGRQEAQDVASEVDEAGPSPWSVLVTETASTDTVDRGDESKTADNDAPGGQTAVEGPPAAVERIQATAYPDRDPEMTDLPEFL